MAKVGVILAIFLIVGLVEARDCYSNCDYFYNLTIAPTTYFPYNSDYWVTVNLTNIKCIDAVGDSNTNAVCSSDLICTTIEGSSGDYCFVGETVDNTSVHLKAVEVDSQVKISDPYYNQSFRYMFNISCQNTSKCSSSEYYPRVEICINGSETKWDYTPISISEDQSITPSDEDFTVHYHRNWTWRKTENNDILNLTPYNTTLKVWCNNYASFDVDLANTLGDDMTYVVRTLERPYFQLVSDNIPIFKREDLDVQLKDDWYVTTYPTNEYALSLGDYTGGQFYKGVLGIQKSINNTNDFGYVWVEEFNVDNLIYVPLENNTQYKIEIKKGSAYRDLGAFYVSDSDLTRDISVSRPDFDSFGFRWEGLTIGVTEDYGGSQVGCAFNSSITTICSIRVYTVNSSGYTLKHSASSTGTDIALAYTVSDNNATYRVLCSADDTTYGLRELDKTVKMHNTTGYLKDFDLGIGDTVLGISKTMFYKIVSLSMIILIGTLFSMVTMSTGAVAMILTAGGFKMIGWFPIPEWLLGFLSVMAVGIYFMESKKR